MAELDHKYLAKLVLWAQQGDSDSFAELYVATYQQQYRFAYRYLQDEYLAQDALQETYILALKNLTTLRDPQVFISWLNQINMRVCFAIYRRERRQEVELDRYQQEWLFARDANGEAESPEKYVMQKDEQDRIMQKITALPFSESQVIQLRFFRNMKISEIAEMMEISQSSVKRYLSSGQKKLEKWLHHSRKEE